MLPPLGFTTNGFAMLDTGHELIGRAVPYANMITTTIKDALNYKVTLANLTNSSGRA